MQANDSGKNGRSNLSRTPLILDELTIESLGTIISRVPFVTQNHIWPVGFTSSRYFTSMLDPRVEVKYTSQIVDVGDKPQFVVTAADNPCHPIVGDTPTEAWRVILQHFLPREDQNQKISVGGTLRFGISHPLVASLIRELPNADKCRDIMDSPSRKRKTQNSGDDWTSSGDDSESRKVLRNSFDNFSARDVNFTSRDDMDDLESAVATLQALKYCTVY